MPTIRLIPSAYAVSSTSYLSVSNADRMYHNTDNTTYATITNTNASTSSRYLYLRGFNFGSIPSDAVISSFTVKIKGYESGLATSTSYAPRLANGTSAISGTTASTNFGTSAKTITIPTGALTWSQIVGYGSNFTIMVYVRRNSRNTTGYFYCYGAEIEVTYTVPVQHTINISGNNVSPSGSVSVWEGESLKIKCSDSAKPTVRDNNVDVTSQLVQETDTGYSYEVEDASGASYGFELNSSDYYESQNKGVDKSAAVCVVHFHLEAAATVVFSYINYAEATYDFGIFGNIDVPLNNDYKPASGSMPDSSYRKACNTNADNSSSVQTLSYSLTAGDHDIYVKFSKDDASASGNDSLQFKVAVTMDSSFTPSLVWAYTLNNIVADHTVVFTSASTLPIRVKNNGSWVTAKKLFVKQNGAWVQSSTIKVKSGGSWH